MQASQAECSEADVPWATAQQLQLVHKHAV